MNQTEVKRRQAGAFSNILTLVMIYILGQRIGEKGITYVAVAAEVCALSWLVVSGGLLDGLGRLLRSRKSKGQYRNVEKMRSSALILQAALGLCGSLAVMALASFLADHVFRIPYSGLILLAFAPLVLLRTVTEVLLGYFQGEGSEPPRMIAGVLRLIFLLGFGMLFLHLLGGYGEKVSRLLRQENFLAMYGGLGIALAALLAELFVILFLFMIYRGSRRLEKRARQGGYSTESFWDCARYLCGSRWPQLFTGVLFFLPFILGLLFCGRSAGEGEQLVLEYGLYAGKYLVVCGVGVCLVAIFVLPVIAKVFQCFKREENRFARTVFQSGVHICLVHGAFLSVFTAFMAPQLGELLCPENVRKVTQMLQGGSFAIAFAALSGYFCRLLHSMGRKSSVLVAVCAADLLYLIIVLPSIGKLGVLSLVYGGLAGAFVLCALSGAFAYRQMRTQIDWLGTLIVPLGAGGVAGLICLLAGKLLSPHLGSLVTLIVAFAAAGAVYWVLLLLLRNFKEQELDAIVGGQLINALGQLLRVY